MIFKSDHALPPSRVGNASLVSVSVYIQIPECGDMVDSSGIRLQSERKPRYMLLSSIVPGDPLCCVKLAESLELGFGELEQLSGRLRVNISRITLRRYPNSHDQQPKIRHGDCVIILNTISYFIKCDGLNGLTCLAPSSRPLSNTITPPKIWTSAQ